MAKQCPECRSVADDDLGYCGACGRRFTQKRPTLVRSMWQYALAFAAAGGIAASILSFLRGSSAP
jgi:hypothetical protein